MTFFVFSILQKIFTGYYKFFKIGFPSKICTKHFTEVNLFMYYLFVLTLFSKVLYIRFYCSYGGIMGKSKHLLTSKNKSIKFLKVSEQFFTIFHARKIHFFDAKSLIESQKFLTILLNSLIL